jgi:hypothetical protein
VTDLSYSLSSSLPLEVKEYIVTQSCKQTKQLSTSEVIATINCWVWPEVSGIQRHSYQLGYPKCSEVTLSDLVKEQSFLWNGQSLETPALLSDPLLPSATQHTF